MEKDENNSEENSTICCICLENFKTNQGTKVYNCSHQYHKGCTDSWGGNCPLCKASKLPIQSDDFTKELIRGFKENNSYVPEQFHDLYLKSWKKHECITNKHNLIFLRPFGVIGICENCDRIESFNLKHKI